ncbi:uncharacterized protein METZ01_LOCUS344369 [marine metagenome]|uniref:Uncharacterized protein n=1 Tax=marine metagenome TaxID=408172 RepID=A0A382R320_9ZZZZ
MNGAQLRGLNLTSMGIERSRVRFAFGTLNHIFGADSETPFTRRSFCLCCLCLASSIDTSGGFEAIPNNRDKRDQDKKFG